MSAVKKLYTQRTHRHHFLNKVENKNVGRHFLPKTPTPTPTKSTPFSSCKFHITQTSIYLWWKNCKPLFLIWFVELNPFEGVTFSWQRNHSKFCQINKSLSTFSWNKFRFVPSSSSFFHTISKRVRLSSRSPMEIQLSIQQSLCPSKPQMFRLMGIFFQLCVLSTG